MGTGEGDAKVDCGVSNGRRVWLGPGGGVPEDRTGDCGGGVALGEDVGAEGGDGFPGGSPALINGTIFLRNFLLRFVTLLLPSILTK